MQAQVHVLATPASSGMLLRITRISCQTKLRLASSSGDAFKGHLARNEWVGTPSLLKAIRRAWDTAASGSLAKQILLMQDPSGTQHKNQGFRSTAAVLKADDRQPWHQGTYVCVCARVHARVWFLACHWKFKSNTFMMRHDYDTTGISTGTTSSHTKKRGNYEPGTTLQDDLRTKP